MKIRLVRAELLHADSQTDTTKLIVAFRYFANSQKSLYQEESKPNRKNKSSDNKP